jgi:hypothetical protein
MHNTEGSGHRAQGTGLRPSARAELRAQGSGLRAQGTGHRIKAFGPRRAQGAGLRACWISISVLLS